MSKNVFGDDEQVDKIVFRPLNIDLAAKVKKVSDPAPRPLPRPLDDKETADDWIPGVKRSKKVKKESENKIDLSGLFHVIKMLFFGVFALGAMAGLGWLVIWVFEQYKIG